MSASTHNCAGCVVRSRWGLEEQGRNDNEAIYYFMHVAYSVYEYVADRPWEDKPKKNSAWLVT
jgi:hypothetical protein